MDTWFGLVGPPGMPKEVVARINRELAVIAKQPAFQDKLAKLGLAVDFKPGDEFIAFMSGRHQEMAGAHSRDGNSSGRLSTEQSRTWRARQRPKKPKSLTWPNGKKVAVSVTVMFETWPDDSAPNYSVQTTHLKKGTVDHAAKAWSTYGGRVGVWRLMRTLERLGIPATFFVNARCTEVYPDAVKQIVKSGFDIAAHSYTQDDLPSYFPPDEQDG